MKKLSIFFIFASQTISALAGCPTWATSDRFSFNGAEVTDLRTGLVWARCNAGENWDGVSCTGNATNMSYEGALQYAAGLQGWRLPNAKELYSVSDRGCREPAIDIVAFPTATYSPIVYWTSSPNVSAPDFAWSVDFRYGQLVSVFRSGNSNLVRLIRTEP